MTPFVTMDTHNLPPEHPLAGWVGEARQDDLFRDRWDDGRDASFRAFAAACLTLAEVARLDRAARLALYRDIATRRRRTVLGEMAMMPVAPAIVRLLAATEWWQFTADDWTSFLTAVADVPQLTQLDAISPLLVRQLADIPAPFRRTNVFEILNTLMVPAHRWQKLAIATAKDGQVAAAIRNIRSVGDFWDTYYLCMTDPFKPFPLVKAIEPYLTDLEPLSTIEGMEAEAVRMDNCLKKLVWRAAGGYGLYFRLRSGPAVTAELRKTATGWKPGDIKGPRNQAIDEELDRHVRQELALLARHLAAEDSSTTDKCTQNTLDGLRDFARANFPAAETDRLAGDLLKIRGRTRAWTDGAYTIFSIEGAGFVQFMSDTDGDEYLCEIASHKFVPERAKYLTASAIDIIEGSGFLWPNGRENFLRWFPVTRPDDCRRLAELSLGLLAKVFGHAAGNALAIKTVLPRASAESTGSLDASAAKDEDAMSPPEATTVPESRSRFVSYPGDIIVVERPNRSKEK